MSGLNKGDIPSRDGWVVEATGQKPVFTDKEKGEGEIGIPVLDQANRIAKKIEDLMIGEKTDDLGCKNRKALKEFLNDFIPRHDGIIILFDFRDFKAINDVYGHKNGDKALQEFVRQINENFRTAYGEDILFRSGGDEFVLVCQNLNQELDFDSFFDKIKNKLENVGIEIEIEDEGKQNIKITVGVDYGISGYYAGHGPDERPDLKDVLHKADQKMYINKNFQRRNLSPE